MTWVDLHATEFNIYLKEFSMIFDKYFLLKSALFIYNFLQSARKNDYWWRFCMQLIHWLHTHSYNTHFSKTNLPASTFCTPAGQQTTHNRESALWNRSKRDLKDLFSPGAPRAAVTFMSESCDFWPDLTVWLLTTGPALSLALLQIPHHYLYELNIFFSFVLRYWFLMK